eukprot:jgi/Tetstr1/428163/TSEL_018214.t1
MSGAVPGPTTPPPGPSHGVVLTVAAEGPRDRARQLHAARVGQLASAAKLRGRFWNCLDRSLYLTAGFNICVVGCLGTYAVRDDTSWSAVHYTSTAACCAYVVWKLWSHRQQKGEQFKAFVLQEGFVYSRMLEMFTYMWLSILCIVFITGYTWTMLAFRFRGCPLPGSRLLMWCFPFFVNLPMVIALDPVTCTQTFQEAAVKKGYPGAAYFQEGLPFRLAVLAVNLVSFLGTWLVLLAVGYTPLQPIAADMYPLYVVAGAHTLALFTLLPRYANMCKSREVLLGEVRMDGGGGDRPRWGVLGALNGVVPRPESATASARVALSTTAGGSRPQLAPLQEAETLGDELSGVSTRRGRRPPSTGWSFVTQARSVRRLLAERAVQPRHAKPRASVSCGNLGHDAREAQPAQVEMAQHVPSRPSPLGQRHSPLVSGGGEAVIGSGDNGGPLRGRRWPGCWRRELNAADVVLGEEANALPEGGTAKVQVAGRRAAGVPRRSVTFSGMATLPGLVLSQDDLCGSQASLDAGGMEAGVFGRDAPLRGGPPVSEASSCDSNTALVRKKAPSRMREWKMPASIQLTERISLDSGQTALKKAVGRAPSLHNVVALTQRRGTEESEFLGRLRSSLHSFASMISAHNRMAAPLLRALRVSASPLAMLWVGLLAMPRGAQQLVTNVAASLLQLRAKWRWWAASHPDRFLFTTGFLSVSFLVWPVVEVPLTESTAALVLVSAALLAVLLINGATLGWLGRADHAMLLHEVAEGGSIGAGLLFPTTDLLRTLSRGGPLAMGYPATEARLLQAAAISCRWDEAASAGCAYMWLDTLSIPQPQLGDSAEEARLKGVAIKRLIPTMTSVYASVRLVLVVETGRGLGDGADAYQCRTWTLQECMLNQATGVVRLDGSYERLGPACSRGAVSGVFDDTLARGVDELSTYRWILSGGERAAAMDTSDEQRRAFPAFANSRHASRASDKAVALGQIYFCVFFEHIDVATLFMMELSALLAADSGLGHAINLIDNTGWDDTMMCGSACSTRYLMGRPAAVEAGSPALWHLQRANLFFSPAVQGDDSRHAWAREGPLAVSFNRRRPWWLCQVGLRGRKVKVAVMPGEVSVVNGRLTGHLHQMRTCTVAEKAMMKGCMMETMDVLWL